MTQLDPAAPEPAASIPGPAESLVEGPPGDCRGGEEPDSAQFPAPLPVAEDDPLGLGFAIGIANGVAGTLPAPRGVRPRRRRDRDPVEQRSGARPDERDPKPLADALGRMVRDRGWAGQLGVRQLLHDWPGLVGSAIADHCRPIGFHAGVVIVQAESTTWATELRRFFVARVVARLNEALGEGTVTRVEIRSPATPSWKRGPRSVRDGRGPRDTYG